MMLTLEELRVQCRIDDDNEQENALYDTRSSQRRG